MLNTSGHWGQKIESKNNLSKSDESFFKLFYASTNPMAITTIEEGRIIDVNKAFILLTGYRSKDLIGRTTVEHGIWADSQQRSRIIRSLQEQGIVHNTEVAVRAKDGNIHTVLFSIEKAIIGREPYLLSTAVDITDQKHTERELRESEEKYKKLVDQSLQGLAVIQNERFVFCNSKFAEISGFSVEELLSLSSEEMMKIVPLNDLERAYERRLASTEGRHAPANYEYRALKKSGAEVWLEVYCSAIQYAGKPAIQAAFMDITERKKALENLQKALDWQKAIFEGSRDAVMISNKNSKIIDANEKACQLSGYSKEELLNMQAGDLNKTADPSVLESLRLRILNGEDILGETQIHTKDGREIDVEFGHSRVVISGEVYIYSICRDISNRKRLEKQFQQAQKMEAIGVLAGGIAHDFNNLLNVINGYSELALEELGSDHSARPDIEQVIRAGQQAASLTSQLLAFSRKQILKPEIMNLNDTVSEMSAMLSRLLGEDIEIATIAEPNLGFINADPAQIQQIIMNLAVNARDAMPKGGSLTIETANFEFDQNYIDSHSAAHSGSYVMLAISDNGIGMDAATQARIFEPFFTTKGEGKGTGLGLSTIYGIVKQNNGFIWVYSEPGKGATFKVYFPRTEGRIMPAAAENKSKRESRGSETILVVEDETPVLALTSRILTKHGYTVFRAASANEGLEISQKHAGKIHLVVADAVMPGMGGKEFVSRIKIDRPDIKALYTSGYTDKAIVHHGILDSDVAFLQKPFTIENLTRKVREVIDS